MDLVFMGTPEFAATSLSALADAGHRILAVVTQPDRPKGRGYRLQPSPVKVAATRLDCLVLQPECVSESGFLSLIREMAPAAVIVVAFGQRIPGEILALPQYGCINVHASLLPKYRGAAPIQRAVLNGDEVTGVTTMYMAEGWDTGDMILKREVPIDPDETAGELHDRLAEAGAVLLLETLRAIEAGEAPRVPQAESAATRAPKVPREQAEIDWLSPAAGIHNLVRALNPAPGAYTWLHGALVKVWRTSPAAGFSGVRGAAVPGEVLEVSEMGPIVSTGDGCLCLCLMQGEGGKALPGVEFARGRRLQAGDRFGRAVEVAGG